MTAPLPEYYTMRIKDIMTLTGASESFARKIMRDVKDWLKEKTGVNHTYILFAQWKRYHGL